VCQSKIRIVNNDSAGVRFPPPAAYAGGIAAGLLFSKFAPLAVVPQGLRWPIAAALFVAFLVVWFPAFTTFVRTKTPLNPNKPVNQLFTSGIYRVTRNPLYLSLTLLYLAVAIAANSLWALLLIVPVLVCIQLGVVRREEEYLGRRFGDEYAAYKSRVRRWL